MKVSLSWLKQLVELNLSPEELADKLSLTSIGVKEVNPGFIELDLTYNRGDLLSLRGVVREVAAITDSKITFEDREFDSQTNLPTTPVQIEKKGLSPVQCVAKIEGLKVQKSAKEWIKKLADSGMRPVNNIADVTNLIMLEYGQPLHAFDEATVKNDTINVRLAKKGEEIITLDGKLRKLEPEDIVLADTEKPLDVAGVMGGKGTEIKESTNTILLSASLFNPKMVRRTAQRLGLHSEASKRFQHGLTKTNLFQALSAAIKMYEGLGGKLSGLTIVGDTKDPERKIHLTQEKINSLIGVDIPADQVVSSLRKLGFSLASKGETLRAWEATVPYWRLDINIEEDLIEEVARMYGYEKIPAKPLEGQLPEKLDQSLPNFIYKLKVALKNAGLTEIQTYSFYSCGVISNFKFQISNLLRIVNPISSETEYLRHNLWPNLVEVIGKNLKQGYKDIAIFEIGKTYIPAENGLPAEPYRLSIALMNGTDNPIAELYQILQDVKAHLQGELKLTPKSHLGGEIFHPTRFADLEIDGKLVGAIAEVHPRILNKLGIEKRVAILEVELDQLP